MEELECEWMGSDGVGGRQMRKGVRKGRRKRRKRKRGGHTMTSPPSYAATSWSGIASPQCQGWCEVVRMEVGEVCRASGCQRWNSSTIAGVWTSVWGSHMLSKFDQPTNLTRYHNLPHLNLESRIFLTLYSSWSLMVIGLGCRGCRCWRWI